MPPKIRHVNMATISQKQKDSNEKQVIWPRKEWNVSMSLNRRIFQVDCAYAFMGSFRFLPHRSTIYITKNDPLYLSKFPEIAKKLGTMRGCTVIDISPNEDGREYAYLMRNYMNSCLNQNKQIEGLDVKVLVNGFYNKTPLHTEEHHLFSALPLDSKKNPYMGPKRFTPHPYAFYCPKNSIHPLVSLVGNKDPNHMPSY